MRAFLFPSAHFFSIYYLFSSQTTHTYIDIVSVNIMPRPPQTLCFHNILSSCIVIGENLSRLFSEHLDFSFSMKCIWNSSIQLQFRNHWTSRLERYIICKTRNSYIIHMKAVETVILWLWQAVKHFWEERQIWKTTF